MCEYFVKADPIQYEQRSRTVRIKNVLTSIRLENMVWDILAEMAEEEGCTTNALIAKFHEEILEHRGEVPNFASFLRVTSMRYLHRSMLRLEKQLNPPTQQVVTAIAARSGEAIAAPKALAAVGR
ncbi:ribbon-helix-helix domain-containing protein [Limnohabitans sp. B9-3]|uniref:ribbon-helix-helix domain-containing protein n=1 Tax=Limnohabitans sp. B9-3 TaxID=1100707 RepID=UPI000C1E4B5C|nr:ribbon-helix-helix domain-containing protein [Limnohabitans sp. B9-3]PIT77875.1 aryl-sulfate sulfotransferase [Limnohabitans sp. B9-3]